MNKAPEGREKLHLSLALDEAMVQGKEEIKPFTVATVTAQRDGWVDARKIATALQVVVDAEWQWATKSLRDGRYIVHCRGEEAARRLEKGGEMILPAFSLTFKPLTADLWNPGKADGEMRWLDVRQLLVFCWNRDAAAQVLKPVGDLVFIDRRGGHYADDTIVAIRVRQGRRLPCDILCDIGTRKHEIMVELRRGEPALPWQPDMGTNNNEEPTQAAVVELIEEQRRKEMEKGKQKMPERREEMTGRRTSSTTPVGAATKQHRAEGGSKALRQGEGSRRTTTRPEVQNLAARSESVHARRGHVSDGHWIVKEQGHAKVVEVQSRGSEAEA